jgi:anthranilate phosphoribosyltransferase
MAIQDFLKKVTDRHNLSREEAEHVFLMMMKGGATPAQIAAMLVALRMKGETIDEIAGAATVMRLKGEKFNTPANTLDTCGTGGDNSGSYNISTTVAFVVAGAGVPVAKHGNRAISSRSGSADVLQELGININAQKTAMEQALHEAGICFMMAPKYHQAMRHIAPVRQEMGVRTIFNILGPLANPANAPYQLLGVYTQDLTLKIAEVLAILGAKRAWVVHGSDGMDEITTTGITNVACLSYGKVSSMVINPADYGIELATAADLQGADAVWNARELREILLGRGKKAYRDIVLLNSAAALVVCEKAADLNEGLVIAADSIDSGRANQSLLKLIAVSNRESLASGLV